jgi:hypothetical protein
MVHFLSQLLTPITASLALLLIAATTYHRVRLSKTCLWTAIAVLTLGSNGWIARWISIPLEWRVQAKNGKVSP